MAGIFNLQIVTPEREVFNGPVEMVSLPGLDGSFGVLRNHAPLIAALDAGVVSIFDPDGAELYLKPALNYVKPGVPVNFYTVSEAARRQNEIAIGYRLDHQGRDATLAYGVRVNANKSEMVTFTEKDKVIVLAEE